MRRSCWGVGSALHSNSSNCLVLILHREMGNYLLGTGESYGPTYARFPNLLYTAEIEKVFEKVFVSGGTSMAYHWYLLFCYFCIFGASSHLQGI